ncbi:MAG: fibro-slime domain-containing protein [Ruminococcus sp.]|nr:fibro-slime domain-containing protein [Ruminococcus sp.]
MYLAPLSSQILSNSTIGVTLSGREAGDYASSIEAWDNNVWGWYGYRYTDSLSLLPAPAAQSTQMLFAVNEDIIPFTTIDTVDSKAAGITMKMFDYVSQGDRSSLQTDIIGESKFTGEGNGANKGLVRNTLDDNGFPTAVKTGRSLEPLFTANDTYPEREANHLFIKSIYDETGYFEYSCFDTSAFFMKEDGSGATPSQEGYPDVYDFEVFQELATPAVGTKNTYKRGNFLPFDKADENDGVMYNLFDDEGEPLPEDDPRYNERIYAQSSVNYHFGMSAEATFMIPENGLDKNGNPLIFEFCGDDDFWLFIDDVLVLDLGGIHNALTGKVNFSTGEVSTYNGYNLNTYTNTTLMDQFRAAGVFPDGTPWDDQLVSTYFREDGSFESDKGSFKDYSSHTMKIFYMERGGGASNLRLRFNLATVPDNSIFLEKKLTGAQTTDYSNTRYAYQLYYRAAGSDDEFTLYQNPSGDGAAHYENSNDLIAYDETAEINGTEYHNVFYIRSGEKAEFAMPGSDTEYYFAELGLLNQEYDYVNINNERIYTSNFAEVRQKQYEDIVSPVGTVTNRRRVIYENHIDHSYLKKLVITKELVRLVGEETVPVDDDKTGFEFQVNFLNEDGEPVPYQKGEYYVMDEAGYYYTYVDGELKRNGKTKTVCSISGNNGSIAGIPDGLSVVIEDLLPTTGFIIEELPEKIPLGYELLGYDRVISGDEATYHLIDGSVTNKGIIKENIDAHMIVTNQKGFGITVMKDWSDSEYTSSHATIYIALFHIEGDSSLRYVDNTLRELVSPNTSIYYFNNEQEAREYLAMEVKPESIVPADWNGDTTLVTDCEPYPVTGTSVLSAQTLTGQSYDFEYAVSYETGEVTGTGNNVRTDRISNTRDHLKIIKLSESGYPLQGAEFTLTDITENAEIGTFTSDTDGLITNAYFTEGHSYQLTETAAPDGYQLLSEAVTVTADENGLLTIQYSGEDNELISVELSDDQKGGTLTIRNKPEGILLRKTSTDGEPLRGAVFTVYQFDRAQNRKFTYSGLSDLTSDENGIFYGGPLPSGYYLIEETKAPNGYALPDYSVVMHIRLSDNTVDNLYKVRYNSDTQVYETVETDEVLTEEWLMPGSGNVTVNIPDERITGTLIIRKTIDTIDDTRGTPAFMFRVTRTKDENGNAVSGTEYMSCITFSASDSSLTKETVLSGLPIGTYKIEELSTMGYTAAGLTVEGDDRAIIVSKTTAAVELSSTDAVTAAYVNELKDSDKRSYTAFADNSISYTPQDNEES